MKTVPKEISTPLTKRRQKKSPEIIERTRLALLGHPVSVETRAKIRVANTGKHHTEETKEKISLGNKGKFVSKETREKIRLNSRAQWSNPQSRAKILDAVIVTSKSPARCLKISEAMKGKTPAEVTMEAAKEANRARKGEKRSKYQIKDKELLRQKRREMWRRDTYVANQMKARHLKPNKTELKFQKLLDKHFSNKWKFVGDGKLIIGGKCPDFANIDGRKNLIELFGCYWHKGENPQNKVNHYKKYGFKCIVIWENELNNEEQLIQKIENE